ncbi:MAG: DUF3857 domain-containing protein [Myxococcaceae bacterium]
MRVVFAVAALALCACPPHLKATLLPPNYYAQAIPADASKYDHEVLFDSDQWLFYAESDQRFSEHQVHRVIRVLSDSGRGEGAQKSNWHKTAELAAIAGQVIQPDGKVTPLERSQVFWTEAKGDSGRAQLAFQLPNVQTGSLVEFNYVIRWPGIIIEANRDLDLKVPLTHYEVEVQKSTRLDYSLRAYHTARDFDVNDEAAFRHVRWVTEHLEPPTEGDYVDWEGPRWLYRNTAIGWTGKYYPLANNWGNVFEFEAKAADVDEDWVKDFDVKLDVKGCIDARCKVERAWNQVHELTATTETGKFWQNRPLKAVVASQTATAHEQVLLFRKLLGTAGVKADTVFVTRPFGRPFDPKFPNTLHDDTVAWVRPDDGLPNGMFVDASCEYCKPGTLRDYVDGANGVRVWGVPKRQGECEPHGELVTVKGDARAHDETQVKSEVLVRETGELAVRRELVLLGADSASTRRRVRGLTPATQRANVEIALAALYPQLKLQEFQPAVCSRDNGGRCVVETNYTVPGGAIAAGNQLSVPLSMLSSDHEKTFTAETRTQGIRIAGDNTHKESVTIAIPSGWKVAEAPKDFEESGAGFTSRVEVKVEPSQVVVTRTLTRKQGRWPASEYEKARATVRHWVDLRHQAVLFTRL